MREEGEDREKMDGCTGRGRGDIEKRIERSNTLELGVTRLKNRITTFLSHLRNGSNLVRSLTTTTITT